jgi:hypothetical protein
MVPSRASQLTSDSPRIASDLPTDSPDHDLLPNPPASTPLFTRTPLSPSRMQEGLPGPPPANDSAESRKLGGPSTARAVHSSSSIPIRSRPSSPLLHEIQPPSRRLSAHQILLLTPFGGSVPQDVWGQPIHNRGASTGMTRESSTLGGRLRSGPRALSLGGNNTLWPMASPNGTASSSSTHEQPGAFVHPYPRLRNMPASSRAGAGFVQPSPLSRPLTTIHSNSEAGSSDGTSAQLSRDPSSTCDTPELEQTANSTDDTSQLLFEDGEDHVKMHSSVVVPMTRCTSLPIMTLRELEALKQKDEELGIVRGGDWAWVSREMLGEEDNLEWEDKQNR